MNESMIRYIGIEDFHSLAVEFIADDLKIQKHFHCLSLSGIDTSPLRLKLHENIFKLIGFEKENLTIEVEEWYFNQAQRVLLIDIQNRKELLELSAEIFKELGHIIVNTRR